MLSYKDFTKHFGVNLFDKYFQSFISDTFSDLSEYNILEHDYVVSEIKGIDLGFINNEAVYYDDEGVVFEKGNPVFSHFILYPKSLTLIEDLPFEITFNDNRIEIIKKAGSPNKTNEGYADLLEKNFLVDSYKVGEIVITFDYDHDKQTINFIQVRDNNLVEHLKL